MPTASPPSTSRSRRRDPDALAARIRNAGAIFLGATRPEVIGDYVAGSNHVLPTARSARFSSGLGVLDFMKRTSILKLDQSALAALAPGGHDACPRRGARSAPPLRRHPPAGERREDVRGAHVRASRFDPNSKAKLVAINLDEASIGRGNSNIEHEREVAIFDILEGNQLRAGRPRRRPLHAQPVDRRGPPGVRRGPGRQADDTFTVVLSLTPLRRIMKDYFIVCETYYQAIRTAPPSRIQSIDMGRRALHDEGSRSWSERLKGKITVDRDTARRLFTLICALHWKG